MSSCDHSPRSWGPWYLFGAQAVVAHGVTVPVLSPEDLMIAKILAGRPKDIEDASGLWRIRGHELDATRIETVLHLLEEALGQSDLLPVFESMRGPRTRR